MIVTVAMGIALVLSPATCLCAPSPVHLSAITPLCPSHGPDAGQALCPLMDLEPPLAADSRARTSAATPLTTAPHLSPVRLVWMTWMVVASAGGLSTTVVTR